MNRLSAVLVASLVGLPLAGATLEQLSLDEIITRSSAIVRGKVISSYAAPHGRVIYTHYRIQVSEQWKGNPAASLDVVVPGGSSGGIRQTFSGAPGLSPASDYVLFLWDSPTGLTHVIGLSQGVLTLKRDAKGSLTAFRTAATGTMVDSKGRPVADEGLEIPLARLGETIRKVLGTGSGASR